MASDGLCVLLGCSPFFAKCVTLYYREPLMHVCFAHSHKPRINIYELGGSVFKKSELFGPSQLRISMHSRKKRSTVPKWSHLESSVVYRNKLRELFNTCPPKRPFLYFVRLPSLRLLLQILLWLLCPILILLIQRGDLIMSPIFCYWLCRRSQWMCRLQSTKSVRPCNGQQWSKQCEMRRRRIRTYCITSLVSYDRG